MPRKLFSFRLILDGPPLTAALVTRLVQARCHDALFAEEQGVKIAYFERSGASFEEEVLRAIADVDALEDGVAVVRVEPDDLVTAGGIAERTDRTRQNVAQLVAGVRGPGGFPPPISTADSRTRIWRWTDVRAWFAKRNDTTPPKDPQAHFVAAVNGALDARRHIARFRREGGSPAIARGVESLMRSTTTTERAAGALPVLGAGASTAQLREAKRAPTDIAADALLREVARRAQDDVSFLATSILPELTSKLEHEPRGLGKTLDLALSAHLDSVRFRLDGDLAHAVLLDHKVFASVRRILEPSEYETYALPFLDPLVEAGAPYTIDRFETDLGGSVYLWNLHASSALLAPIDSCVQLVLASQREPRGSAASLHTVVDRLLGADHEVPTSTMALMCCDPMRSRRVTQVKLWDDGRLVMHRTHPIHWGSRAYEASAVRLLMSSWTFTSALRLLTEAHLPEEQQAVADVVGRIEDDLAAWTG